MALDWDITKCKFEGDERKELWPLIEAMIWLTMSIDIGRITEENVETVELRLNAIGRIWNEDHSQIIAILPKLIGLSTNVSTLTDKQFIAKLGDKLWYEIRREKAVANSLKAKETV
jgi:hypothetical protein